MTAPDVPPPLPSVDDAIALSRIDVNNSDTGNAKLFVNRFGKIIAYVPDTDVWYVWTGTHWEPDVRGLKVYALTEAVVQMLRDLAENLPGEPGPGGGASERQRMMQHALKTEGEGARRRLVSVAQSDGRVIARPRQLNAALNLLACPNGTVDLITGDLITTRPEHMSTACTLVKYDPNAKSPELDRYLETFMPDAEDQSILWGLLGTALRGGNSARILPLLLGPTTSGKSQLISALANLLQGYATSINASIFRGTLDDKPRPDLVKAMHVRLAYANEASKSWELHADQVKRITGGDKILYRNLYAQAVESEPLFTPIIIANEMPRIKGADDAVRRRMLVLRFTRSLTPGREDTRVRERFANDEDCLAAILARIVEGARSPAFVNGINVEMLPTKFLLETQDAFDEVDHVGSFLFWLAEQGHLVKAEVDTPASHCVKASDLHRWYVWWCKNAAGRLDRETQMDLREFGQALRTRGWEAQKANSGTRWLGQKLVSGLGWETGGS